MINLLATGLNFIQVNGATLGHPDLEVLLGTREGKPGRTNSRLGFTKDDSLGSPHIRAWSWYAGTIDLDLSEVRSIDRNFSLNLYRDRGFQNMAQA